MFAIRTIKHSKYIYHLDYTCFLVITKSTLKTPYSYSFCLHTNVFIITDNILNTSLSFILFQIPYLDLECNECSLFMFLVL